MSFNIRIVFFHLVFIGFLLMTEDGFSQNRHFHLDSIFPSNVSDTLNVEEYSFRGWVYGEEGVKLLNSLESTHNYHPLLRFSQVRNDLGNIGSADHIMLYDLERNFGFQFRSGRRGIWKALDGRKFLLSDKMFSNVQYANGANRENYLMANFTRGFGQLLNLGFSFNRITSKGFYSSQSNTFTDVSFYATFHSKDKRYKSNLIIDYSALKAEENGGISNDSVFENNLTSGRSFIPVNLPLSMNRWKGFDIGLEQRFFLVRSDSIVGSKKYRPAISHSFSIAKHSMIYENLPDTSSEFYQNIFLDTLSTYDSTNVFLVSNALRFELVKPDSMVSRTLNRLAVGAQHDYHRISYDSSFVQQIHNLSVIGHVNGALFRQVAWRATGKLMVYGYNLGDFNVSGQFEYSLKRSNFWAVLNYSLFRPDFITDRYISNHFIWNNSWVQSQHLKTGLIYEQTRLRFRGSFTYHLLDKLVVFGADKLPFQSNAVNQLMVLRLQERFKMCWFHVVMDGALQWKMSGDDIRVPLALGRGSLYYQNDLFKKKLRLQVGVEVSYATSYFANGYNPALSDFYIQNDKKVGGYPFIDVFLNIRVKKLRAFFKVEHLNAGWLGYDYYHVPGYPANDLAWKFGVNWAFLD